jgi:mannose/cellobiose epimerase-like protein (N-acyl-D-glucosamine 2-epimerase family)
MTANMTKQRIVKVLKNLMVEYHLPFWSREGWNSAAGGFVERLDVKGKADRAAPRRIRVQARQIYCFAKSAQLGWYPQGREIAIKGLDYLLAKAKSPDGRPGFVRTGLQSISRAIPMTTHSYCWHLRQCFSWAGMSKLGTRSNRWLHFSIPVCDRLTAVSSREFQRHYRAGRIRICICSKR